MSNTTTVFRIYTIHMQVVGELAKDEPDYILVNSLRSKRDFLIESLQLDLHDEMSFNE